MSPTVRNATLLTENSSSLGAARSDTVTSSDELRVRSTVLQSARSLEMSGVCDLALTLQLLRGRGRLSRVGIGDVCQSGSGQKNRNRTEVDHDDSNLPALEDLETVNTLYGRLLITRETRRWEHGPFYIFAWSAARWKNCSSPGAFLYHGFSRVTQ